MGIRPPPRRDRRGGQTVDNAAERYARTKVCRLSLTVAAEPNAIPTRFPRRQRRYADELVAARPTRQAARLGMVPGDPVPPDSTVT
jgi:hypothetical protein